MSKNTRMAIAGVHHIVRTQNIQAYHHLSPNFLIILHYFIENIKTPTNVLFVALLYFQPKKIKQWNVIWCVFINLPWRQIGYIHKTACGAYRSELCVSQYK